MHQTEIPPVRFESNDEHFLELSVLGYEYPELLHADYDSNWLIIQLKVHHPLGSYRRTAPVLLTRELVLLIDWITALAHDCPAPSQCRVIEPTIWFKHCSSDQRAIQYAIYLDVEFSPPWVPATKIYAEEYEGFPVEITHTRSELLKIAQNLRKQLALFPPRSGW